MKLKRKDGLRVLEENLKHLKIVFYLKKKQKLI